MILQGDTTMIARDINTIVNRFYRVLRDEHPAQENKLSRHYFTVKRLNRYSTNYYAVIVCNKNDVKGASTEKEARKIIEENPGARVYEFERLRPNSFCFNY